MKEIWKKSRLVDTVEVSNKGRVRNSLDNPPRAQKPGEIRYLNTHKAGYLYLPYKESGKQKCIKVHRLVAFEFVGNPNNQPCVNHIDGNKANNLASNLEWCSHLENMRHAFENGLIPPLKGELNGRAVLNEELVHQICQDYSLNVSASEVIAKYSITRNQAIKIKSRLTWKHISSQYKF